MVQRLSLGSLIILLLFPALLIQCKKRNPPLPQHTILASELPRISVTKKSKLMLTYIKPDGTFTTADSMEKVPKERRGWVRVVDLNLKPQRRKDHQLVYVADLRQHRKDGTYPYVVLSRSAFESAAANPPSPGASTPAPTGVTSGDAAAKQGSPSGQKKPVILYSTSWCGACRAAKTYFKQKGIAFVEKDIEADPQAAAELLEKAKKAGISASGVPVIDVGGTLMQGFDPNRIQQLLGE